MRYAWNNVGDNKSWVMADRTYEIRPEADNTWTCWRLRDGCTDYNDSSSYDQFSGPHALEAAQAVIEALLNMEGFQQ